jgi:transcriptional regulator GlxA family with amidase domain
MVSEIAMGSAERQANRHEWRQNASAQWRGKPLRVGFVLTRDFTLSALSDFVDVLRLAADDADHSRPIRCQWYVMSASSQQVRSSCGVLVSPTSGFISSSELDYIVVVGGLLRCDSPLDLRTTKYLLHAGRTHCNLVGVCTGSFVLCRLGLLEKKKCCISWFHYRDFVEEFHNLVPVADHLYVIDGNRITCPGGAGATYLAAELVARHLGASTAKKALHMLHIDRMKPGWSAQPSLPPELGGEDDRISRALLLMEQNLSRPVHIGHIAAKLYTSTRQLERLFREMVGRSPHSAYLQLRLKHAKWMLSLDHSLASIAANTGFSDGAHFGKAFKAAYGINPSEERRRLNREATGLAGAGNSSADGVRSPLSASVHSRTITSDSCL